MGKIKNYIGGGQLLSKKPDFILQIIGQLIIRKQKVIKFGT